jgi:hypothetical protein
MKLFFNCIRLSWLTFFSRESLNTIVRDVIPAEGLETIGFSDIDGVPDFEFPGWSFIDDEDAHLLVTVDL